MKPGVLSLFFLCICSLLMGQTISPPESRFWYFGSNAALDFAGGTPVAVSGSAMFTSEGSVTVSDAQGNLLFYGSDNELYDASHAPMQNGSGLLGTWTTNQMLAVEQPGNPGIWYVFIPDDDGFHPGFRYQVIDMSQNGGLGAVVQKNVMMPYTTTEGICAIPHTNGSAFWVVTHATGNDVFQCFLLDCSGLSATPVTSAAGQTQAGLTIGQIKPHPSGRMLAYATSLAGEISICGFDPATGQVRDSFGIPFPLGVQLYSFEFSPQGKYLWTADAANGIRITQHDVSLASPAAVIASVADLIFPVNQGLGGLQNGPDGKMWLTHNGQTHLSCFTNPDQPIASAGYTPAAVSLGTAVCRLGLPGLVTRCRAQQMSFSLSWTDPCLSPTVQFQDSTSVPADSIVYQFGDGTRYTGTDPVHTYAPGNYTCTVIWYVGCVSDTLQYPFSIAPDLDLGPDQSLLCATSTLLDAGTGYSSYLWSDGSTGTTLTATQSGTYWVEVSAGGCTQRDTLTVQFTMASLNISGADTLCPGDSLQLTAAGYPAGTLWAWSTGSILPTTAVMDTGWVSLTATYLTCIWTDSVYIWQHPAAYIPPGGPYTLCQGESQVLDGGNGLAWTWSTGATGRYEEVRAPGIYTVITAFPCDTLSRSFQVTMLAGDSMTLENVFTPNGDGLNDVFDWKKQIALTTEIRIVDRWGMQVFQSTGNPAQWDGTHPDGRPAPAGVYYFTASGFDCRNRWVNRAGSLTLLR